MVWSEQEVAGERMPWHLQALAVGSWRGMGGDAGIWR